MSNRRKVISILLCICMLMQATSMAVFAEDAVAVSGDVYQLYLPDMSKRPGELVFYDSVNSSITDSGVLFSLIYNSTHYDEDWVDRDKAVITFDNLLTDDVQSFTQETYPLVCVQYEHWFDGTYYPGKYDVEFTVPHSLPRGTYKVTIQLDIPAGKEADERAKPITFTIDKFVVLPSGAASGGGGSAADKTVVSEKYYDAAKVCYDLELIPDIYEIYNQTVTKETLAYALVELAGLTGAAESSQNANIYTDLTPGTKLNGCATALYQYGVLQGDGSGKFGPDTEMTFAQIIKCVVDILGFTPVAQQHGGYPNGYLIVAARYDISKNVSVYNDSTITGEQLAQIIYNALESKRLVADSFSATGTTYKVVDDCLLYLLGYDKYIGNVTVKDDYTAILRGTMYNSKNTSGVSSNTELTIGDQDIKTYPDDGMKLYCKDGRIVCGLKYYSANFTINENAESTASREVTIAFDVIGYPKCKIGDGNYDEIPESKSLTYTLPEGCGSKSVKITFESSDGSNKKEITKSINLKQTHRITYMVDNNLYSMDDIECGGQIPALKADPTKSGYTFEGWDGLPEVMPDEDITVYAKFAPIAAPEPDPEEPEESDIFVADLPSWSGVAGETAVITNVQQYLPEEMRFGLCYASTMYKEYILNDEVFTFENDDINKVYTYKPTPLISNSDGSYDLEIPVPEDLPEGEYTLTIELDIAMEKNSESAKPYKLTIAKFYVDSDYTGDDDDDDNEGNTPAEDTDIIFNIKDTTDLSAVSGAEIIVKSQDGTVNQKLVSDSDGKASFAVANGSYNVQVIASGYEMRNFTVEKTDEQAEFTAYLNKNPLVNVQTSVKEMTKQEMIDAGIDINAVENKHIYKCVTVLKFIPAGDEGSSDITPIEINFDYVCDEDGTIIQAKPAYCDGKVVYPVAKDIYLIIHSEVTWLKEMFDVQLVVANTSVVESIKDCEINLNLPDGLSLAVMTGQQQSLKVNIAEIAPLATSDIHWYVCGDKEGEYLINGNIIGTRVGGGITEDLKASFTMQTPITVLAGNAMKLLIEAEKFATVGQPYKVRYTLQNVSSKTLYDVALNVLGGKFCEAYSIEKLIHDGELVNLDGLTGTFNDGYELKAEEFKSGDILSGVFEITFGVGIEPDHTEYMVSKMFTFTGAGSTTTIPTEIVLVDSIGDHDHSLDEGTVTVEPTCTSEGKKVYTCTGDCDYTNEIVLPKTDHELGDWVVRTEPTCTRKGEKYKKCKHCSYKITAELLEGSHQWDNGRITTPPTEEAEGIKTYDCKKCSATKEEKLPKLVKQDLYFITGETMNRVYNGSGETIYNKADNDSENGGAITYTSSNEAVAKVDNSGKLTILGAGETTITATAAATDIYAKTTASYVLTVSKAPLTVKANDVDVFYGNSASPNGYTVSGLVGSDRDTVVKGEATYSFEYEAFDAVGEYPISVSGLDADNYTITFEAGKINVLKAVDYTIEFNNLTQRKGQLIPVTATISPADESAVIKIEYQISETEWSETMPEDVGEYNVRASLIECNNIEADASKYSTAILNIKAGALISGADGSSVGIEIVENEDELEYIIPDEVIDDVIASVPETGEVVIDSSSTDTTVNNLVLPSNIIKAFDESDKVESLTILADASEITIDKDVIGTLAESIELNDKLRINIEVVSSDSLTEEQQSAVNAIAVDATVLQLNLDIVRHDTEGNIVSTESVHELNGNVDIRTAYTLPESMVNKRLVVCYVSDNGSTTYMRADYVDGFISFSTDHFSHYVIAITDCTHSWDSGEVITPATTSSTGLKKYTCTLCGGTKEEIIPVKSSGGSSGGGGGGGSASTTYTIKFETNCDSKIDSVKVEKDEAISEPATPVKEGYTFLGWYTDSTFTTKYDFSAKVTKSFTLYANWSKADEETKIEFKDVASDAWYYDAVKFAVENKLMNGVSDSEFDPESNLTRAMFVTILYRLEKEPAVTGDSFADVTVGSWYENAVKWATENKIVNGISDTEFAPDNSITREQMSTIIYRYAKFKGYGIDAEDNLSYTDNADISEYAKEAVIWANAKSIMTGNADGSFAPLGNATRAQAAAVFMRIIENLK